MSLEATLLINSILSFLIPMLHSWEFQFFAIVIDAVDFQA